MKKIIKWIVIIFIALLAIGFFFSGEDKDKIDTEVESEVNKAVKTKSKEKLMESAKNTEAAASIEPVTVVKSEVSTNRTEGDEPMTDVELNTKEAHPWYVGDTSQLVNIGDWVTANEKTKLVYAADIIVAAHKDGYIVVDAKSIDDYRPYDEELVKLLDDFSKEVDVSNRQQVLKEMASLFTMMLYEK